ncbi:DNA-binding transcription repressor [Mortierella sp. GBA43]|nr:DNA-binding transcription repressor [Mortierella sp. GBA43]
MEIDPPAAVVAAAVAAAAATTPLAAQLERADIPTPPSTVTVPSTRRMEDSVPVKREPKVSPSLLSLPPATPSANLLDTPKSEKALADVEASTGEKDDHQDEQDEQDEEDASLLPLWAQRQLTIRRQSLIPRNELDFVKGSGIIPPPNTNLVLPGGARIKAYPTLLSDIVKVQREELLQEASRLAEEEAEMAAAAHHASKRRKASSASQGKGGRNSFSGQGTHHHDDDPDYTHDHQHDPDMNGVRTRRFSHAAQGLAAAAASDDMQTDRRRRRGGYGADDNDAYYPAGSSPTLGHGGEYHSGRPGKLGSPVELPNGTFDETVTPGRRGSKGKINRHGGKISKPSTGANPYSRERSWEDSRDADHHHHQGQFHHQQYSDEDGHHYSMQQRKTSIHGAKDKKPPKALTKSMDDMDQDGGDYTRRRSLSHIKEHPHQARYAMMPGSSPDSDMARQQQQQQHPGFGSSLRTLQPLLNATQYDHHHPPRYGDHLVEQQQQQQHGRPLLPPMAAAGRGGYNSSNSSQVPGMGDKKIKYNAAGPTKSSPKGNFGHAGHVKRGGGAPPHGKPRSSHLYGSTDESLAMAEALMEMHHVGAMDEHEDDDDDATEDEYVPHKRSNSGADYHYSDHSQDDGHHHSHPIKPSPVKKTTVGQKRKLSGQGKAAPTSGFGAMSPPQAKKKKAAHGDSSKGKTKDHKSTSSAGRHHGGGMSFDPTGAGSGSGAGAGTTPRSSSGSGGSSSSKHCEACGAKETPCWRPGYIPNTVLCNSCGLRYKKSNVFCTKIQCKYIPLKTEYASMEAERQEHGRDHLICIQCKGRVALPIPKEEA